MTKTKNAGETRKYNIFEPDGSDGLFCSSNSHNNLTEIAVPLAGLSTKSGNFSAPCSECLSPAIAWPFVRTRRGTLPVVCIR
jgi:hypothetical protein